MSARVLKYTLGFGSTIVTIPAEAKVLDVQMQNDRIRLWALADETRPPQARVFLVIGTGFLIPEYSRYISTVQMNGGALIFHIFELLDEPPA